jgi:hypothetical protein
MVKHQELIEAWRIRPFAEQKRKYFCGIIDALNTYCVSAIEKDIALIYERRKCHLRRTPLRVRFDNPTNPELLIVEENRIAWFTDKTASAKIHFHSA